MSEIPAEFSKLMRHVFARIDKWGDDYKNKVANDPDFDVAEFLRQTDYFIGFIHTFMDDVKRAFVEARDIAHRELLMRRAADILQDVSANVPMCKDLIDALAYSFIDMADNISPNRHASQHAARVALRKMMEGDADA